MTFTRRKSGISRVQSKPVDPKTLPDPKTPAEYIRRGMVYYARKQFVPAIDDFKKAIELDSRSVDGYYGLGMVYKAMDNKDDAVAAFRNVIIILESTPSESRSRATMLRRLALGHINEMNLGDWNLEKEIWIHINSQT